MCDGEQGGEIACGEWGRSWEGGRERGRESKEEVGGCMCDGEQGGGGRGDCMWGVGEVMRGRERGRARRRWGGVCVMVSKEEVGGEIACGEWGRSWEGEGERKGGKVDSGYVVGGGSRSKGWRGWLRAGRRGWKSGEGRRKGGYVGGGGGGTSRREKKWRVGKGNRLGGGGGGGGGDICLAVYCSLYTHLLSP